MSTVSSLSPRSVGWLRYLHRKATTEDCWDRDGTPHDHWDNRSDAPMLSWRRFDLIDSTYAVALMADRTPAWREVYQEILDELIFRHTGWWAAEDWLTQSGHDPDRGDYPDAPFEMIRDGDSTFTWWHSRIAQHLADQWRAKPLGCHCENTKIWPLCLSAAGLGLQLHDTLRQTNHHEVFHTWWRETAAPSYFAFDDDGRPADSVTFYYDPIIDQHHRLPVSIAGFYPSYYLAPQRPDEAHRLFDAALAQAGVSTSGPVSPLGPRVSAMTIHLATEWGMTELAGAMREAVDAEYEPTWDHARGEFSWGFKLDEPHPRGQYNGAMAAAEAMSEGAWTRVATTLPGDRFDEPTVEGVSFPEVELSEARWDGALHLTLEPLDDTVASRPSTLSIRNLPPGEWTVTSTVGEATLVDGTLTLSASTGSVVVARSA